MFEWIEKNYMLFVGGGFALFAIAWIIWVAITNIYGNIRGKDTNRIIK